MSSYERGAPFPVRAYQKSLVLLAIVIAFTNFPRYSWEAGLSPLHPVLVLGVMMGMTTGLLARPPLLGQTLRSPLTWWAILYVLLVGASYFAGSHSQVALAAVLRAWFAATLLVAFVILFADRDAVQIGRRLLVLATVCAVLLNIFEVFRPLTFSVIFGRSAGLYLNPNIAASAVVMGMVLSLECVRPAFRLPYAALCGVGVFTTLSRSGILAWAVACVLLALFGRFRYTLRWGALFAMVGMVVVFSVSPTVISDIVAAIEFLDGGKLSRLTAGGNVMQSTSIVVRAEAIRESLSMFESHPLLGEGTGATREWRISEGTHNIYLRFLAEHGIVGPIFYLCSVGFLLTLSKADRPTGLVFAATWLVHGLFSHNDLETPHSLLAIALASSLSVGNPRGGTEAERVWSEP